MSDLLAAAERVKAAVEAEEARLYVKLTRSELDRIYTYQSSVPTGPKPGFVYKREFWRIPGNPIMWTGWHDGAVRWAIGEHLYGRIPARTYEGPLESYWIVYTCEIDPDHEGYVLHRPKEAKILDE